MRQILYILGIASLLTETAFACRFTVREIGFADFGNDHYHLYFYKDSGTSDQQADFFRKICYAAFLDANVEAEVVDPLANPQHPALQHYNPDEKVQQLALVSHTGDALMLTLDRRSANFAEEVWLLAERILSSKARAAVLDEIVSSYAVVLLVDGIDEKTNRRAQAMVDSAVTEIKNMMASMPKPVQKPPALVKVEYRDIESEQIFLWSLGYDMVKDELPAITVLYGRGRQMGRLLPAGLIGSHIVRNLLAFVGADCECGLDRSWILGPMFPGRWDSEKQQQVLAVHHFDAENPLIKAEMSQILSIAPNQERTARNAGLSVEGFSGYTENEIQLVNESMAQPEVNGSQSSPIRYSVYLLIIAVVAVSIVATVIILKSKRREL